ncbi:NCS1 family nucleobase:cation symporter-1 [Streptomyces europaeiscabiei]|uniref:NCS1 family nucleobase:cation symporter-1 n=1 Tax=Streptomyces europaeiscabiei TaxID=146819 RepID=A0AAJ2UK53_9ACTN|nr:NCS1 family nucleobase:cation symporter-1 [Streptomyces europaeiscabiei]MDX3129554.1 NCS1 family nucleobase:cation symporter-1 [Streptomyces europaeiscabiei]
MTATDSADADRTAAPPGYSPRLYNADLAPATERKWGAFSIFNVWTSDVHSLYGYFLAASLFLVAGNTFKFLIGIGVGSLIIYWLMTLIGKAGVKTGVPYPVLARASFGTFGANVPALVRAVVATFWYGAQTSAAAGAIVAFLVRYDGPKHLHETSRLFDHSGLEVLCYLGVWAAQLLIISKGMETVRRFQDFAGPAVWVMMLILAIALSVKAGTLSFSVDMPSGDLAALAKSATGLDVSPGSLAAIAAIAATWVTYFAALFLNFGDFARFTPDTKALKKGNLWGLPVNLVLFSLVAAITTAAASKVYGEVILEPAEISAKFDSAFLVLLAALTFAVATLGINVVANFVSPAFDFANVAPKYVTFRRGGLIAAVIALLLYPLHPWDNAPSFVNAIGSTMGPIFGVIVVDYYLIRKTQLNVPALYEEDGEFRFQGGWNVRAFAAGVVGAVFSSILPVYGPSGYGAALGPYSWFIGVAVAGVLYFAFSRGKSPHTARTAETEAPETTVA